VSAEVPRDWFDGFFEHEWLDYLALGEEAWTAKTVAFLVEELGLHEGSRVLDVACGRGRVAIPLAQHGCRVTGIDLSPNSLARAREAAEEAGVDLELVHLDMRALAFVEQFDAAINVFTSFGYFEDEADDRRVVAAIARALVPGGTFLIDHINTVALMASYRPKEWTEFDDGTLFLEERRYDHLRGRHEATWTFVRPDGSRSEIMHSLRGYTSAELRALLEGAGLHVDGAWGSWDRTELGEGTRTILRARRPA
jgi:SAM-dependent methyltransferase